jgi:hypothetical protein
VQLTLAILEVPSLPAMPRDPLDPGDRAKALEILARIIAQTLETGRAKETIDE